MRGAHGVGDRRFQAMSMRDFLLKVWNRRLFMKWSFWIDLYIRTHCVARGLRPLTVAAYEDALQQFREWVRTTLEDRVPDQLTARDVLAYLQHLREVRGNGDSAVNRAVVILRRFYRAIVAIR